MKRFILAAMILPAMFFLGCSEDAGGNENGGNDNPGGNGGNNHEYVFEINPLSVDVPAEGGQVVVTVSHSTEYHAPEFNGTAGEWISQAGMESHANAEMDWVTDDVYTFTVAANTTGEDRKGYIAICELDGNCLSVAVKQSAE